MRQRLHQSGYLLIELIAALTLVAIAVAALIPSVAGRNEAARREEFIRQIIDLDRRARAAALRDGPVVIRIEAASLGLVLIASDGDSIGTVDSQDGEIYLLDASTDEPLRQIRVDRLGRTADYRVLVRASDREVMLRVVGVSGLIELRQSEDAP